MSTLSSATETDRPRAAFGSETRPPRGSTAHVASAAPSTPSSPADGETGPSLLDRITDEIARLESRHRIAMSRGEHLAEKIAGLSGSMPFAACNALFFSGWILLNSGTTGINPFDPYPFGGLTVAVSLEAIFLAIFVLISQNRQALQSDRRATVDLQMNTMAEREITKLIELVAKLHDHLGTGYQDPDIEEMKATAHVDQIADAVDSAHERNEPERAHGPASASDTQA